MVYELDDPDIELLAKCREAIKYDENGDPMKDILDEDDFKDAVYLLVRVIDAEHRSMRG